MKTGTLAIEPSVPLLIVKIGRYPLHHGGVGVIRSLGRVGVPVYAVTEDRFTPAAVSRYLCGRFVWPTTGLEDPVQLVAGLLRIGRHLAALEPVGGPSGLDSGRAIVLATDDEAAVLLAEHAEELAEYFVAPAVPPALPGMLADKYALADLCRAQGIPYPESRRPASVEELAADAARLGYPVIVKNAQPWERLHRCAVGSSTVLANERELLALTRDWAEMPSVVVQEYVPAESGADWVVNIYCDAASEPLACFTGVKMRSWPVNGGVGSLLYAMPNETIAEMTAVLCHLVGYRGIADLDWRLDRRSGTYKLLDFNPRIGAQFQVFRNESAVDVVRALYLDLTGQPVPTGPQVYGRGLRVEHLDIPAAVAHWRLRRDRPATRIPWGHTRLAWLAADDPMPAVMATVRSARPAATMAARLVRHRGAATPGRNS